MPGSPSRPRSTPEHLHVGSNLEGLVPVIIATVYGDELIVTAISTLIALAEPRNHVLTQKIGVLNGVTDGARTRDLRSHNPYEQFRMCPARSSCVAYLSRIIYIRGTGYPRVSGCVLASIAAALLPSELHG